MLRSVVLLCFFVVHSAGCGPGGPVLYPVSGTVTLDGKPVDEGTVTFENAGAGVAESAAIGPGGKYTTKLFEGSYTVSLLPAFVEQQAADGTMEEVLKNPKSVPRKYQNGRQSGLTVTVTGETKYDVPMTKN